MSEELKKILSDIENDNEIEILREEIHQKEAIYDSLAVDYRLAQEEIERLNNIIKEVREDIKEVKERYGYYGNDNFDLSVLSFWIEKLEILDKGE